jgi:hypothetical protein
VVVRNDYFEQIDDVSIGSVDFGSVEAGAYSLGKEIGIGRYSFRAISVSGLIFESTVDLRGDRRDVLLRLSPDGKLEYDVF